MATLNKKSGNNKKKQTVDTSRTSNQGRKLALGGSKETDNKGRPTSDILRPEEDKTTKRTGRNM